MPEITNDDLLKEIKYMGNTLLKHDSRLKTIERRHELIDVGKEAISNFKKEQREQEQEELDRHERKTRIQVLKELSPLIAAGTALLIWLVK